MRLPRSLAVLAAAVAAALTLAAPATAAPASAAGTLPPAATAIVHPTYAPQGQIWDVTGTWYVNVNFGFDYSPATNNLRAFVDLSANNGNTSLQVEPLRLGDRNGVLKERFANAQGGRLVASTDAVQCHKPSGIYRVRLYFSIRWPDGTLLKTLVSPADAAFERGASTICV